MNINILEIIRKSPTISQRKIALKSSYSLGKVNGEIKRLEKNNYIEIEKNSNNQRYKLTEAGRKILGEKERIRLACILGAGYEENFDYPGGFVKIGEKTLIERSLDILLKNKIKKIYIVAGYKKQYYLDLVKKYSQLKIIVNSDYLEKGSYFSLKSLKGLIEEDFILLDSDILYEEKAIDYLLKKSDKDIILISDEKNNLDESYVEVQGESLIKISKDIRELKKIDGEMLGINKISKETFKRLMELPIENNSFSYEYAISEISDLIDIKVLRIDNLAWGEVDTLEQLEDVREKIYPRIKKIRKNKRIKKIKTILKNKLNVQDEDIDRIESLGGMTNKNYLITINNKNYVLRIPGNGTEEMIDRVSEGVNTNLVSKLELDKTLTYFDQETGIKISEYIEGARTINPETAKKYTGEITTILRTLHNSNLVFNNKFDVFIEIKKYEKLALDSGVIFYPNYRNIKKKVMRLEQVLDKIGKVSVSCHNDTVPENFILGKKLHLIDWEYSGMNDPMWDIAAHSLECQFTLKDEEDFLGEYFNRAPDSNERLKIEIFKICQDFLWSIWTLLKESKGDDFGKYGVERYRRAIKGVEKIEGEHYRKS